MSNQVILTATEFIGKAEDPTYGFRIYDSYASCYCNILSKEEAFGPDLQLLYLVSENAGGDEDIQDMLDAAMDYGILINNNYYGSDEVREIIE